MLAIEALCKRFGRKDVLFDVTVSIGPGEAVGLVGESGSGKTTMARCILGLEPPTGGRIRWDGEPAGTLARSLAWRKDIQAVFQDPRASLDPRWTIRQSVAEPVTNWFPGFSAVERDRTVAALVELVGLAARYLERYPHELSTGECQRACIARALGSQPRLLVLDEPLSALDVTIQAQILRLLREIRSTDAVSYLFISHDIAVVSELCDRILVLHRGRIVEEASRETLLTSAQHPYTRTLLSDVPVLPDLG